MSPSFLNVLVNNPEYHNVYGIPDWGCWIIIAVLLLISALFSASENAFSNCNKYHFKVLADEGKVIAKIILKLVTKFDNTLVTILVGNNIVQTLTSYLSAMLFYNLVKLYNLADGIDAILSTVCMGFLVYIVSDTVPKIISKEIPNKLCYFLAYPVYFMYILLTPIRFLFQGILYIVHKLFKIKDENILTKDDFILSADEAVNDEESESVEKEEEQELFEPNEIKILNQAFYFDLISVKDVLTPSEKIFALDINGLTTDKLNEYILNTTYSRIPIYDKTIDNIIGILNVKVYFMEYSNDSHLDIRSVLTKPFFVDKNAKVDDIFKEFNREKMHIAIVKVDDKVVGMVTMEDILEELVGEISEKRVNVLKEENKHG